MCLVSTRVPTIQTQVLGVFTYNFVPNIVKKRFEHPRVLLEILLALTFPLGKAGAVA